jgi:uncharacterized protein YqgV (UPF0045/DUF77 family)
MFLAAQVSIYPLRQQSLSRAIDEALDIFKQHELDVIPGAMSSVISGDDEVLFKAIRKVVQKTSEQGEVVVIATFSNACPVPRHKH